MSNIQGIVDMLQNKVDRLLKVQMEFENYKKESIKWSVEDILDQAKKSRYKCNRKKAKEILHKMIHEHDASIGINWEVIVSYIELNCEPYKR